jgi:lipopolysaccharide export LptBFGC system permease protein LptF
MRFKQRRTALVITLGFLLLAAVYFALSHDAGGTTTIAFLAIAGGVAAYALVVGTPDDV